MRLKTTGTYFIIGFMNIKKRVLTPDLPVLLMCKKQIQAKPQSELWLTSSFFFRVLKRVVQLTGTEIRLFLLPDSVSDQQGRQATKSLSHKQSSAILVNKFLFTCQEI